VGRTTLCGATLQHQMIMTMCVCIVETFVMKSDFWQFVMLVKPKISMQHDITSGFK
jgi:hypothetical protein